MHYTRVNMVLSHPVLLQNIFKMCKLSTDLETFFVWKLPPKAHTIALFEYVSCSLSLVKLVLVLN